ncbi:vacuolar iron transporter homolog 1 [Aegilops tauschii subsp. strangulata]|uniref:Vacuolar iron transporter n=1 Tax=Aegilops tauschii subsp. strangulata TaxID=200361 RepID=A0A453R3V2_AEGTS|nr:vacuolar iron transporter homolog 1 [Aegilops tauschii subsp. strangulata]
MIGVGAVNESKRAMLVSGIAGFVSGACSMAIDEFVSVYAQYNIEVAQIKRTRDVDGGSGDRSNLPSPTLAAGASALAFAASAALPLLSGGFVRTWAGRVAAVCPSAAGECLNTARRRTPASRCPSRSARDRRTS